MRLSPDVEVTDISTPAAVIRYTNNWKGNLEGWLLTPEVGLKSMKKELPGLKNFYMAGQWVEPGEGLPAAIMSGRNINQIICKKDIKKIYYHNYHRIELRLLRSLWIGVLEKWNDGVAPFGQINACGEAKREKKKGIKNKGW